MRWWEVGIFKLTLLSIGILIGLNFKEMFVNSNQNLIAIAAIGTIYTLYIWTAQQTKNSKPVKVMKIVKTVKKSKK